MEEIEVSFELKNSIEEAQKKLKDLKFIEEQNITDVYFYDPNKYTSKPSGDRELRECLRLRNINGKYIVSYKIDKFNDKDEYVYSDNTFKESSTILVCKQIHFIPLLLSIKDCIVSGVRNILWSPKILPELTTVCSP
jgi:hypothetical protein